MKTLVAVAAFVIPAFFVANRPLDNTNLNALVALDGQTEVAPLANAFTAVNERALPYLPAAATLRAENAVAAFVLATR